MVNDDIRDSKDPVIHDDKHEITDIAKCFHGDGPAGAIEAGQQKNGRYPCWICPADLNSHPTEIVRMHYLPCLTLKERHPTNIARMHYLPHLT